LILLAALLILHASFCAFTSGKFTLTDYGKYTNMLWNCGHGAPFRMLVFHSYLQTHVSFTLALLGPAFRLWDHPFLPAVLQWLAALGGVCILGATGRRLGLSSVTSSILALSFLINPFTQSVLLSEFHGVSLYLLLVPWLFAALRFRPSASWIPLLLTLGVREEAGFLVLPLLLDFAVRKRWRAGYALAAFSAAYALVACTVLFPWLSGTDLAARRPGLSPSGLLWAWRLAPLSSRLIPLLWFLLPAAALLPKACIPALTFPSLAIVLTTLSPFPAQHTLSSHYPAAGLALLFSGIVQGMISLAGTPKKRTSQAAVARRARIRASLVLAAAIAGHWHAGFLPGGRGFVRPYRHVNPDGLAALQMASALPKNGVLLCSDRLAGFCANRADILACDEAPRLQGLADCAFFSLGDTRRGFGRTFLAMLSSGQSRVLAFDGIHVALGPGTPGTANEEALRALAQAPRTIRLAATRGEGGSDRFDPSLRRVVRYWNGDARRSPITLCHGSSVRLSAGQCVARFRLRAAAPVAGRREASLGRLGLYQRGTSECLADRAIEPSPPPENALHESDLVFTLCRPTDVEPRVTGGGGELWLESVFLDEQPTVLTERKIPES
jgi:uncharacterized membrane protein